MSDTPKRRLTLNDMRQAVQDLANEGVASPSIRVLHARLGRGSLRTIHSLYKLIREEQARPPEANADLAAFRSLSPDLSARVTAAIRAERAAEVEQLRAELAQARRDCDQALAANEELTDAIEACQAEVEAVRSDLAVARSQLLQAELEHRTQLDLASTTRSQVEALAELLADLRAKATEHH